MPPLSGFIHVDTGGREELIFKQALHALDLLQSPTVAVRGGEAGGSQQAEFFVNVAQLPVQILGFVALLLNVVYSQSRMHIIAAV